MKKTVSASIISLVVAAFPVVGNVMAADYDTAVVDQVQVTVNTVCNMTSSVSPAAGEPNGRYHKEVTPNTLVGGSEHPWEGTVSTLTYTCNDAGGWKVTAQGVAGVGSTTPQTVLKASGSGTDIVTGTATEGYTSNWAFRVSGTGAVSEYTEFSAVPGTTTTVASSTDSVLLGELTPEYRVWVSPIQEADTYTGYVKYILSSPL